LLLLAAQASALARYYSPSNTPHVRPEVQDEAR